MSLSRHNLTPGMIVYVHPLGPEVKKIYCTYVVIEMSNDIAVIPTTLLMSTEARIRDMENTGDCFYTSWKDAVTASRRLLLEQEKSISYIITQYTEILEQIS